MTVRDDFKALKRVIGEDLSSVIENEIQIALENLPKGTDNKLVLQSLVLRTLECFIRTKPFNGVIPFTGVRRTPKG